MADVAIASCLELPEPDPDAAPLSAALSAAGIEHELLGWDDPAADWSRARLTLLRSTWNYPRDPRGFLGWAERVAKRCDLWNPLPTLRWNLHKRYLVELARAGIPTVPTEVVAKGTAASIRDRRVPLVIKPAISAASFGTLRVTDANREAGEAHLRELAAERDVLIQPYLPSVEDYGERALVWVDGRVTHAVRKSPRFAGQDEAVSGPMTVTPDERRLAERCIAAVETPLLYARIDVAPGADGKPLVMELELVEPSLFFDQGPEALERLVAALRRRLDTL